MKIFGNLENLFSYFNDLIVATVIVEGHDIVLQKVIGHAGKFNSKFNENKI